MRRALAITLNNGNEVIAKRIPGGFAFEFRCPYTNDEPRASTHHKPIDGFTYTCISFSKEAINAMTVIAGNDVDWSVTDV